MRTVIRPMIRLLAAAILVGLLVGVGTVQTTAQGIGFSAQIVLALRRFLTTDNVWTGTQTFTTNSGDLNLGLISHATTGFSNATLTVQGGGDPMNASIATLQLTPGAAPMYEFDVGIDSTDGIGMFENAASYAFDGVVASPGLKVSGLTTPANKPVCFDASGNLYAGTNTAGTLTCP